MSSTPAKSLLARVALALAFNLASLVFFLTIGLGILEVYFRFQHSKPAGKEAKLSQDAELGWDSVWSGACQSS